MMELPIARPRLLVFCSWLAVLAWTGIAVMATSFLLTMVFSLPLWAPYGFVLLLPYAAAGLTCATFLRCPHCRRCVTVQTGSSVHPASLVNGTGGWASVVVRVLRARRFVCIHCGEKVAVRS